MLTVVINQKGGAGKSSLSYSLTVDTNSYYYTNDRVNSINHLILPQDKVLNKFDNKTIKDKSLIFDSGGFNEDTYVKIFNNGELTDLESQFYTILKARDLIIIPIEYCMNTVYSTLNFLTKILRLNRNVIFVVNKYEEKKEVKKISKELFKNKITKEEAVLVSKEFFSKGIKPEDVNVVCNLLLKKYIPTKSVIKTADVIFDTYENSEELKKIYTYVLNKNIKREQIFTLPKSKAIKNMLNKRMSIKQLYFDEKNVLSKKWYKKVYEDYNYLLEHVNKKIDENLPKMEGDK